MAQIPLAVRFAVTRHFCTFIGRRCHGRQHRNFRCATGSSIKILGLRAECKTLVPYWLDASAAARSWTGFRSRQCPC